MCYCHPNLFGFYHYLNSHNSVSFFRLLQEDKNNLEALRMLALYSLCSEGNITEVKLTHLEKVFVMANASYRSFFFFNCIGSL